MFLIPASCVLPAPEIPGRRGPSVSVCNKTPGQLELEGSPGTSELLADVQLMKDSHQRLAETLQASTTRVRESIAAAFADARENHRSSMRGIVAITLLCVLSLGGSSTLLARSVSRRLNIAVQVADRMAHGDLTVEIVALSKDETGQLLGAMKNMTAKLRRTVGDVQAASAEQSSGVTQMTKALSQVDQVTLHNASAAEEMASTAAQMAGQAESLATLTAGFRADRAKTSSAGRRYPAKATLPMRPFYDPKLERVRGQDGVKAYDRARPPRARGGACRPRRRQARGQGGWWTCQTESDPTIGNGGWASLTWLVGRSARLCLAVAASAAAAGAAAPGLIVDDTAASIELHVTAVQQQLLQLSPTPLHSRLHAGQRQLHSLGRLLLGEASQLRQLDGLPVVFGKPTQERLDAVSELRTRARGTFFVVVGA